jgi:NAD(P)-dependent dehydrogenase (short-subunit alcohol dehydrogenase family)
VPVAVLGATIARRLAQDGYRIVAVDTNLKSAKSEVHALPKSIAYETDVTNEAAVEAMLDAFGEIPDVLVNNAGIVRFGPLSSTASTIFARSSMSISSEPSSWRAPSAGG